MKDERKLTRDELIAEALDLIQRAQEAQIRQALEIAMEVI